MSKKQAVVIIHGIGNQQPMDTLREFVQNIKDKEDIIYSSPDKVANYYETRKLQISSKRTDFYEYYWANLMTDAEVPEIFTWAKKLIIGKCPSERAEKVLFDLKMIFLLILSIGFILFVLFWKNFEEYFTKVYLILANIIGAAFLTSIIGFLIFRYLIPRVNSKISSIVGDAFTYLSPFPKNIGGRYHIRNKGLTLLRKLHELKDENDNLVYDRIIIVGHSLGSVIGYDLITNLWVEYVNSYKPESQKINQSALEELTKYLAENRSNKNIDMFRYQKMQRKVFAEIKSLGNPWLISDFITVGSPLTHGSYLFARNETEFNDKKNYREIPTSPPEVKVYKNQGVIIKNEKEPFYYNKEYKDKNNNKTSLKTLHHAAQFSFICWHNIFFENDYVGGPMDAFGKCVQNYKLNPTGSYAKRKFPFWSHTEYWHSQQSASIKLIKQLLFKN